MVLMSTSERPLLNISSIRRLAPRSYNGLRIDVPLPGGIDEKRVLRGEYSALSLHGSVGNPGRARDFIGTYWAILHVVSGRFKRALEENGLTGWRPYPLTLDVMQFKDPLWLLAVVGRCGPVFGSGRGELRCPALPPLGHYLDPHDWDGSDFFLPKNHHGILITASCAKVLESARLKNLNSELSPFEALPDACVSD